MAFLDNSGDIILDAVLTDTGRKRLAKGDGSFKIDKFALGDDEIDYSLYENTNHSSGEAHISGSAYYDLNIMMTPILEAFTNNTSSMKSKLLSLPRTNLLYLPILKLNNTGDSNLVVNNDATLGNGQFVVATNEATENAFSTLKGVMTGFTQESESSSSQTVIKIEQGLDTTSIPIRTPLDKDLKETQYIIEMDNRLGSPQNWYSAVGQTGGAQSGGTVGQSIAVSYIDDDNVASYYVSLGSDPVVANLIPPTSPTANTDYIAIKGPLGTKVVFNVSSSLELSTSDYLFTKLGGTGTAIASEIEGIEVDYPYKYIDTNIRVTGATTGASIDIPIRFVKID